MLTVTHGRKTTRSYILVYTALLFPVAVGLGFTSVGGPVYLTAAILMNAWYLWGAYQIWRRDETMAETDSYLTEKKVFKFSLLYLFGHFTALLAEAVLKSAGWGGWS
jgi:protoheme IX farnesyltransferase